MSVSKYNSILQATEREERNKAEGDKDQDLAASESSVTSLGSYSLDAGITAYTHAPMARGDPESSLETNEVESSSSLVPQEQALSFVQGLEESIAPTGSFTLRSHALDISEQVEAAMELTGPFICQLLLEHKSLLSKVLVGADGKSLLTDGTYSVFAYMAPAIMCEMITTAVMGLARNKSVVEVAMLLCSQVSCHCS